MTLSAAAAGCCAICRRTESGFGYTPPGSRRNNRPLKITWTCNDHIALGRTVHHMPTDIISRIERQALMDGGDALGAYLDKIGKTDLTQLTLEEFETMLAINLNAYGASMTRQLEADKAPF